MAVEVSACGASVACSFFAGFVGLAGWRSPGGRLLLGSVLRLFHRLRRRGGPWWQSCPLAAPPWNPSPCDDGPAARQADAPSCGGERTCSPSRRPCDGGRAWRLSSPRSCGDDPRAWPRVSRSSCDDDRSSRSVLLGLLVMTIGPGRVLFGRLVTPIRPVASCGLRCLTYRADRASTPCAFRPRDRASPCGAGLSLRDVCSSAYVAPWPHASCRRAPCAWSRPSACWPAHDA